MERVVNIHCDGRLAYTGFLSRCAFEFYMSERALTLTIDNGLPFTAPDRSPAWIQTEDGLRRGPRVKFYRATWRDA